MDLNEARSKLQTLLEDANPTPGTSYKLVFIERILRLEPPCNVPAGTPIIASFNKHMLTEGLSVGQWIRLTQKIILDFERLTKCSPLSKP